MKITVLIATRDRSASLRSTLESLFCDRNRTAGDWEAVVVDNGSSDDTPEVCASFRDRFPGQFRFYTENRQGKSNALNLGISIARGEVLALTDDDVICAPDYIASIHTVFERYAVDAAQGRVFADCTTGLPEWMSEELHSIMGISDCGDEVRIPFKRSLFGTNLAVFTETARAIGGFAPELGAGSTVGFSEDTEFSLRLRHAGYRIIYAPQIVVHHHLSRHRLTRPCFYKRYFRDGRSRAYFAPYEAPLWRFGLYVVKNLILSEPKAAWYRWKGHPAEAMDCQCDARRQAGFFWQHCLFYFGVPRRLTRITSWPEQVSEAGLAMEQVPAVDHPGRAQTVRG
ncbi:MAG TPA: glycosyltransferase [Patescibacteria group bacterium]|nr:glycosyltransferase [Patescibacteria group bacterium]